MLTTQSAARLLADATRPDGQQPLATALGFGALEPLDAETALGLGIPVAFANPRVARGPRALRLLALSCGDRIAPDALHQLAARLTSQASHMLWLTVVSAATQPAVALVAWLPTEQGVRTASVLSTAPAVLESDAETVAALAGAQGPNDLLVHQRWMEILSREALSRRFYRTLRERIERLGDRAEGTALPAQRMELALICASRFLFMAFLETRGWLDGDHGFIARHMDRVLNSGGGLHHRLLEPLFFGTLNTRATARSTAALVFGRVPFLNGGLFTRTPLERRLRAVRFDDDELTALIGDALLKYRFSSEERGAHAGDSAIDPEILGRTFESLMASEDRRTSGTFYTPLPLVERVTEAAVRDALLARGIGEDTFAFLWHTVAPAEEARRERGGLLPEELPGTGSALRTLPEELRRTGSVLRTLPEDLRRTGSVLRTLPEELRRTGSVLRTLPEELPRTGSVLRTLPEDLRQTGSVLRTLRLIDPACGSGAFLVRLLERLSALSAACGDQRPEWKRRADIVARNLFGVDINPTAVWLCELRLWLAVILPCDVANPMQVPPLPNLDHNIRVGDALAGGALDSDGRGDQSLRGIRLRYSRASGARKRVLARLLDRAERDNARLVLSARRDAVRAQRADLIAVARGPDLFGKRRGTSATEREALAALRIRARELQRATSALRDGKGLPFSFVTHFPDAASAGGFDVVIGNPPWVRLHHIPPEARERFRRTFVVFREAAWEQGARDARAGRGFASQVDLAALFAERSMSIVRENGTVALLLPAKLWRSLAGGGVRRLLGERYSLQVLEDWSDAPPTFDAAVYPSIVVARRAPPPVDACVQVATHRRDLAITWRAPRRDVALDPSAGAPWLILPPDALRAFARVVARGVPLIEHGVGRPMLGVKCGCNAAFLVQAGEERGAHRHVAAGERQGMVERALVRPLLRGEGVVRWRAAPGGEAVIYTHDPSGLPLRELPPLARQWLAPWRRRLVGRADMRGSTHQWWQLFRVEAALTDRARVVWADFGRRPCALVLEPGDACVPLNTCYVMRCRDVTDAWTIAALFNSDLAAALLGAVAEPARGGYRRYMAWAVARLPLPPDWARARDVLAPVGMRAAAGERVSGVELLTAVLSAYRLRSSQLAPLLEWVNEPGVGA